MKKAQTESKVAKPKKKSRSSYNWSEIEKYIENKYGRHPRDWAGRYKPGNKDFDNTPYQDFWHWLLDHLEIHNGSLEYLTPGDWPDVYPDAPEWIQEIWGILEKEFGHSFQVYFSW